MRRPDRARWFYAPAGSEHSDRAVRLLVQAVLAVATIVLIGGLISDPTKRTIELVAGIIALAVGYAIRPAVTLCCAVCLVPFPLHTSVGTTTTLLIFATGVLLIIKSRSYRLPSPFVAPRVDAAIAALVVMMLLSLSQLDSRFYGDAALRYSAFASALVLYYMSLQVIRDERDLLLVIRTFMFVAGIIGLIGTLQTLVPDREWLPSVFKFSQHAGQVEGEARGQLRIFATFPGISSFGEFVGTSIVITYALARRAQRLPEKLLWLGIIILLLIALAGSATRMGVIIAALGFAYMLVMGHGAIPRRQLISVMFVAVCVGVLGASLISPITDQMVNRLDSLGADDSSVQSRWGVMEQAIQRVPDSPWLGHGIIIPLGTFRGFVTQNIHCLYITLAYTIGIPGLLAFVLLAALVYRRTLATVQDKRVPQHLREIMLVLHTSFVMFLVYQLTSDYVTHSMHMHIAWLRLGLLMACDMICRRLLTGSDTYPVDVRV